MARVEISNKFLCKESNLKDDTVVLYHQARQDFIAEVSYSRLFHFLNKYKQNKLKELKRNIESEIVMNLDLNVMDKVMNCEKYQLKE